MQRAKYTERVGCFQALLQVSALFSSSSVHQFGIFPNSILQFLWRFHYKGIEGWIPGVEGPESSFLAKGGCLALRTIFRTCGLAIGDKVI